MEECRKIIYFCMNNVTLDQQFANLIARARVSPYFDFERALCLAMEAHMQRISALANVVPPSLLRRGRGWSARGLGGGVTSVAKIFSWPSEELCACLHKSETDHLYIFDASEQDLSKIESTEPMLRSIDSGDHIVILNEWTARYLDPHTLEQLLLQYGHGTNEELEQELCMHAHVNARGNSDVDKDFFRIFVIRA